MEVQVKTKTTTFDKIVSYYLDKSGSVRLSDKQEKIRNRWVSAYGLIVNWEGDNEKVVELLQAQYKGLSRAQAYRDIRNAINLFGDINKTTKDGIRNIINQATYSGISIAVEQKDLDNLTKLLTLLMKNNGTDKDDPDLPDFKKMQPPVQLYQINNTFIEKYGNILPDDVMKAAKKIKIKAKEDES